MSSVLRCTGSLNILDDTSHVQILYKVMWTQYFSSKIHCGRKPGTLFFRSCSLFYLPISTPLLTFLTVVFLLVWNHLHSICPMLTVIQLCDFPAVQMNLKIKGICNRSELLEIYFCCSIKLSALKFLWKSELVNNV